MTWATDMAIDFTPPVAVTAFANKQVFPVASALGQALGPERTCLFVAAGRVPDIPTDVLPYVTVATKSREIPTTARVVLGVSHKFGVMGEFGRMLTQLAAAGNGERPFDVLFVDEAWQLPLHLYTRVCLLYTSPSPRDGLLSR